MKPQILLSVLIAAVAAWPAGAAELRMSWRDHPDDGQPIVELEAGQEAVINIWVDLGPADTLSGLGYLNEPLETVVQAGTMLDESLESWVDDSIAGTSLGSGGQKIVFTAANPLSGSPVGPGEFLIGSQTVRLVDGADGQEMEIVFALAGLSVINETGDFYTMVATESELADAAGFFHIGNGSPGYTDDLGINDAREPLIVRVITNPGGDDGTANDNGPANDNLNDNVADNANENSDGGVDSDDDGVPDDVDDFPDDGSETTDTDGDGIGDNADPDDDNDGMPDEQDETPQDNDNGGGGVPGDGSGQPTGGGGGANRGGACGFGIVGALPFGLAGLFLLHSRGRRSRLMGGV